MLSGESVGNFLTTTDTKVFHFKIFKIKYWSIKVHLRFIERWIKKSARSARI